MGSNGRFGRDYKKHEVRRHPNVGGMLAQRRRRWTNITPASGQRLMFAGCDWPSWISLFRDEIPSRVLRLSVLTLGNDINTAIYWYFGTNKWNESGFRPPLCTYRLNWARRTSWGWWDDWDDTVLQTQDSKFEPWRSEAEHATSRSRRLPTILTFTRGWGRNNFVFFQTAETGNRTPDSSVKGSGANHHPRAPAHFGTNTPYKTHIMWIKDHIYYILNLNCNGCDYFIYNDKTIGTIYIIRL